MLCGFLIALILLMSEISHKLEYLRHKKESILSQTVQDTKWKLS